MAKAGSSSEADSPSYMETHDLVYAKDSKRSKVKTHREVESVLNIHFWKPATASPVNGWMDYCYQPPNSKEEIRPVASLPAPSLPTVDEIDLTPRIPPPSPDDWKLAFFHASLECVQQFAARVNEVTGEEVLVVQEKPYYWVRVIGEELEGEARTQGFSVMELALQTLIGNRGGQIVINGEKLKRSMDLMKNGVK